MILQGGIALILIWILNIMWMVWEVIKHTPNWKDEDIDSDEIIKNFMSNTPLEKLQILQTVIQINPLLGMSGIVFLLIAVIL